MSENAIAFINPPELAAPPGYSQVVDIRRGRLVYVARQVALDRAGSLVGTGDSRRRRTRYSATSVRPSPPSV